MMLTVRDHHNKAWYLKKILIQPVLFIIIIILAAHLTAPAAAQEIAVSANLNDTGTPQVSGHRILWCDTKEWSSWPEACFLYDINEKKAQALPMPGPSEELQQAPSLSGDRIAYTGYSNNPYLPAKIRLYTVTTGTTETITEGADPHSVIISGNWIVWDAGRVVTGHVKTRDFGWVETWAYVPDVRSYNLDTGEGAFITNNSEFRKITSLDNEHMVYAMFNSSGTDIYLFNLLTGEDRYIAYADERVSPWISGEFISWTDRRAGDYVHLYNIRLGTDQVIAGDARGKSDAVTDSGRVVWFSSDAGISELICYNITTGRTSGRNLSSAYVIDRPLPAISGNIIVWLDRCNGHGRVYYLDLSGFCQPAEGSGGQVTGMPDAAAAGVPQSGIPPTRGSSGFDAITAGIGGMSTILFINSRRSK